MGLADDTDVYKYYDLDWIVTIPSMDPHIKQFEILEENDEHVIVRTGFEAVMEKKLGLHLLGHDIFMNVAGGVKINEPAVDLGIIGAIASSFLDKPVADGMVVLGEVGLTGEVRAVSQVETRVQEIKKLGFSTCLIPKGNQERMSFLKGVDLVGVRSVREAVEALFP